MYTRGFAELSSADVPVAGGKGAFLGELTQLGATVPPGFVILTEAFARFLAANELATTIPATIADVRHGKITVESAAPELQERIVTAAMPEDVAEEITAQFARLDTPLAAVRSSAVAEDSVDHSWAGQLESYLNVTAQSLLADVRRCWASLFSPRAMTYRLQDAAAADTIAMAVVVQAMVNPEVAGVAFSVDPVTEDPRTMVIEAVFGLGEAIVQGWLTPDHYLVSKATGKVLDQFLAEQERGIYLQPDGATDWRYLDSATRTARKLDDDAIAALAGVVQRIERHVGFPADIEWACRGGRFYIVQCRPITTLREVPDE